LPRCADFRAWRRSRPLFRLAGAGFPGARGDAFLAARSKSGILVLSVLYFFLGVLGLPMILFALLGMLDAVLIFGPES